ncbi:beta-glucosidase [Peloplasma aerotolerans]|uniref:Glycoside hydrolase family 3 C-terminal domain-containing protein n=1 Tax=Peloplasma aerotolerans TaxID=3044389 RepID=A0AAW6U5V8_9MOLU|nr:glycoside hydrolase family 3 C-terminal domain-containing protein [Mariniplasma sp. M4Ah]MDI6453240.1 glycoside hydrolase family 3 C-terminal domain-containing protein [Mariniplasma sp. M4Ah]
MKKMRIIKKILTNVLVALLIVTVFANNIAGQFSGQINSFLNINTSVLIKDPGDGAEYVRYYDSVYSSVSELKAAGLAKTQEVVAEGATLLKNDGILPLLENEVSLFGATAAFPVYGGTGSGAVDTSGAPTFVDSFEEAGLTVVNKPLMDWYVSEEYGRDFSPGKRGINEARWSRITQSSAASTFGKGEVAVFVVGRVGGEASDLAVTNHSDGGTNPLQADVYQNSDYLMLNREELGILEGLKALKDAGDISGIVVLINSANPISSAFLEDDAYGVDAAMWIGSVGQNGIYAVGELLTGEVNPSGSLPNTWWTNNLLNPAMANFGAYTYTNANDYNYASSASKYTSYIVYQEGIYIGYRYTETRYEDTVLGTPNTGDFTYDDVVAYPFGYGLSYTTFGFSDFNVTKNGSGRDTIYSVSVKVTNTGSLPGKKTVQIYAQKPYTDYDIEHQIEKSSVDLVGYGKTSNVLNQGQSEIITVSVPEYYLASYDALGTGAYIINSGKYFLTAAQNSHEAINNILAAKGKTVTDGMTANGNEDMVYSVQYGFDALTYAKSYGTGADVTSLFESADINRYVGGGSNNVTYLSRNNWEGTLKFWQDTDEDGFNDNYERLVMTDIMYADTILDDDDIPLNDNNWPVMGSAATRHKLISLLNLDFDHEMWDELLDQLTYAELSRLTAVGLRMTVSLPSIVKPETLDHNGPSGVTQRYSAGANGYANQTNDPDKDMTGTAYPCNGLIAATMNDQLVQEVGELIGEDAMWAGYAGLYGTGINIHRTPYAGRVFEYFSEDGTLTGLIAAYKTLGIQSKGVYVYNKHLALNDQEFQRQGLGTWVTEQAIREIYLRAFELPIVYADAKNVMTSFNRIGAVWAGASKELLTDWLRGEVGMSGFAVTDMYEGDYMSKPHELLAGNDLPDNYPGSTGTIITGVTDLGFEFAAYGPNGETPNAQIAQAMRESAHRVLYTVLHSRGMDSIDINTEILEITPWWQTTLTASIVTLIILSGLSTTWLIIDMKVKR